LSAGFADGHDLRVGGWIVLSGYGVNAFGNDPTASYNDGRERSAAEADILNRELDGSGHEFVRHKTVRSLRYIWL
jgi:hypothetical protein